MITIILQEDRIAIPFIHYGNKENLDCLFCHLLASLEFIVDSIFDSFLSSLPPRFTSSLIAVQSLE
jgi:hypothetical protein